MTGHYLHSRLRLPVADSAWLTNMQTFVFTSDAAYALAVTGDWR